MMKTTHASGCYYNTLCTGLAISKCTCIATSFLCESACEIKVYIISIHIAKHSYI